ncbi:MAG: alpha-ribazole phosphatase [Clostridia bacterium]|nr:alpha-ribazole phosphatase [Clostridia bacterium]
MTLLYLVRHGETQSNREGRYQGSLDIPLNEEGREQARRLARRLAGVAFDAAYASDLKRAVETARILLDGRDIELRLDARLREMSYGRWEGLTVEEIQQRYPEEWEAYRRDGVQTRVTGGESLEDVRRRVAAFADEVLQQAYRRVLVVSHGAALKTLLFTLAGLDLRLRGRFVLDNTSLTIVRAGGQAKPRVLRVNDVEHLGRPLP